jgi:hypothetical protein
MSRLIVCTLVLTALIHSGCTSSARLHNLDTGEVIPIKLKNYGIGEGEIVGVLPNGKEAIGAHVLVSGGVTNWATHDCQIDSEGCEWATSQGFKFDQPNTKYGYAVVVADGVLIKMLYAIDRRMSYGCGIDNNGRKYRLIF